MPSDRQGNDIHKPDGWEGEVQDLLGEDTDPADRDSVSNILEGLLGATEEARQEADNARTDTDTDDLESDDSDDRKQSGRWTCRHCETTYGAGKDPEGHHGWCQQSIHHWDRVEKQREYFDDNQLETEDGNENPTPDAGGNSPEAQQEYLISPQWHEFRVYLKYTEHGLDPYYACHNLMRNHDWSEGKVEAEFHHNDRPYTVRFWYSQSRLEPWDNPDFRIKKVREYEIEVEGPSGLRSVHYSLRPRWPDMESEAGYATPTNPRDMIGLDVDAQGSNLSPEAYPELLDEAMTALGINGGSEYAYKRYCAPIHVEPWSRIVDGELYVRIDTEYSGRVIGLQGPLERLGMLLAGDREGYRKRVADDSKCEGYYHTTTLGSKRVGHVVDGHQAGKEWKHYHVQEPDAVDEDEDISNPKVGVSLQNSRTDVPIYWNSAGLEEDDKAAEGHLDLLDIERELDEALLNVLRWADLPVRPDHQVYVDDAIWTVEADRRERVLVPDPLPKLENEQEHMVTRTLHQMTESDAAVLDELLADGGQIAPRDLADRTGFHYETILRSIDRMCEVIQHNYDDVRLKSKHIAQQLAERAGAILDDWSRLQQRVDSLGDQLARAVDGLDGESAFSMWAERYLEGIEDEDDDPWVVLRFGYRPEDMDELKEILTDGTGALRRTLGEQVADESRLARWAKAVGNLQDGTAFAQLGAIG